jgi:hypothetical protein
MVKHQVGRWSVTCRDDGNVVISNASISNTFNAQTILSTNRPFTVATQIAQYSDVIVNRDELAGIRDVVVAEYFTN